MLFHQHTTPGPCAARARGIAYCATRNRTILFIAMLLWALDPELGSFPGRPREDRQRVRFRIEHPLVERDEVFFEKQQVEVFQPEEKRKRAPVSNVRTLDLLC